MKYNKETAYKIVKFLRFRSFDPWTSPTTYMPLNSIAKFLNRSTSYVQTVCSKIIADSKPISVPTTPKSQKSSVFD